jgi:hypothetical protein
MKRIHRFLATVGATCLTTGVMVMGPVGSAHATPTDCEGGKNGFVDISDSAYGNLATNYTIPSAGVAIELDYGTINGKQRAWARLGGDTQPGDQVWMDWTQDGGTHWLQCGPFTVSTAKQSKTSAAKETSPDSNWRFRAVGYIRGQLYPSKWW